MILRPELLCELPVSAASGLVIHDGIFYFVADDEVNLYAGTPDGGFKINKLWPHSLPEDPKARKKVKPDLECLFCVGGELYAYPSGSRPARMEAVRFSLANGAHDTFSLDSFYGNLPFQDLNIEGATFHAGEVLLFQRGNGKERRNAIISAGRDPRIPVAGDIRDIVLPEKDGVLLTFTDCLSLNEKLYFLAVAEAGDSTFLDGEVKGACLGLLDKEFEIESLWDLEMEGKPEGLAEYGGYLFIATDDDSPEVPSRLYRLKI